MKKITIILAKTAYGLVLPLYLFWFVFFNYYRYQQADQIERYRERMEEALEIPADLHLDENFFHALLYKNLHLADTSQEKDGLSKRISALKKAFPGTFKFIIWDNKGQIDQQLSEEKSFQYVLKTMYQLSHELQKHVQTVIPPRPSTLGTVQQKTKLLRGYFGQFFVPELMVDFFRSSYRGLTITVSEIVEKRQLWVYAGRNFSTAVFIGASALGKRVGPRLLVNDFNRRSKDIKLAYITPLTYRWLGLPAKQQAISEFIVETRKFEENAISFRQTGNYLMMFRQVSPELLILSYLTVEGKIIDPVFSAGIAMGAVVKWLLIFIFIWHSFTLRHPAIQLSVQRKFFLLLFFANGLPALIVVSTGYEYFNEKKTALIEAQQQESLGILREIDARFPSTRAAFAEKLNAFVDSRNHLRDPWNADLLESLRRFVISLKPGRAVIYDQKMQNLLYYGPEGKNEDEEFFRKYLGRCLEFVNISDVNRRGDAGKSALEAISSEDLIFLAFLRFLDRITMQNTGSTDHWVYMKLLGDFRNFNSWGIFAVMWKREEMLRAFVDNELDKISAAIKPRRIAVMEMQSQIIMPSEFSSFPKIKRMMHQTGSRRLMMHDNLKLGDESFLFCSVAGNELSEGNLMILYPRKLIEAEIGRFKLVLLFTGFLVLVVLYQIVRLFSQRLITPIENLSRGIDNLRMRNFRYRVETAGEDEIGNLVEAFNTTMEGLQDLAIGTAVQESLLPEENFRCGKARLFARSLFMTKMGGDYFDYFPTGTERLGIIFGDVAGHGVPAAIIMAMAKAVIAAGSVKFCSPADMLERANQVLLHLKEKKLRRMMTCQCLDLNCQTGFFNLANAGHCYPILVRDQGKSCSFFEVNGMPLGNKARNPYEQLSGQLEDGDVLILYTDGIIEASNESEEMFGYNRFQKLIEEAFSRDLEKFWQGIIEGNRQWTKQQDDDLTLMLIGYGNE